MKSINCQGLSRRDRIQQECFEADNNKVFIYADLAAGEPTVLAHYSQDPNYLNATLRMIGKRPYYDKTGVLILSDPYIMVASKFAKWKVAIREAFEATDYEGGKSGFDMWVENEDVVKARVKKIRNYAKTLGLALVYGMGAKRMVLQAQMNRFDLTLKEAKEFKDLFWSIFPYAKKLGDKLAVQFASKGVIINDFGYALYPEADYKCMNAVIQSSVSGIMDLFGMIFFEKTKKARFITYIHDEIVFEVVKEDLDQVKAIFYDSVQQLNKMLGWSVPIRFGWAESETFYIEGK